MVKVTIEITDELTYIDTTIPKGTKTRMLTKTEYHKMERCEEKTVLARARHIYKKREIEGCFAYLKGKWRWVYQGDYKII